MASVGVVAAPDAGTRAIAGRMLVPIPGMGNWIPTDPRGPNLIGLTCSANDSIAEVSASGRTTERGSASKAFGAAGVVMFAFGAGAVPADGEPPEGRPVPMTAARSFPGRLRPISSGPRALT